MKQSSDVILKCLDTQDSRDLENLENYQRIAVNLKKYFRESVSLAEDGSNSSFIFIIINDFKAVYFYYLLFYV